MANALATEHHLVLFAAKTFHKFIIRVFVGTALLHALTSLYITKNVLLTCEIMDCLTDVKTDLVSPTEFPGIRFCI